MAFGRFPRPKEASPFSDINVTPMLDLAYVLLVIFIIMTTASVQGVRVDLPKTVTIDNLATALTAQFAAAGSSGAAVRDIVVSVSHEALVFSAPADSDVQNFGIIASTLFSLVVIPVVYFLIKRNMPKIAVADS